MEDLRSDFQVQKNSLRTVCANEFRFEIYLIHALGSNNELDIKNRIFKSPWQYCTKQTDLLINSKTGEIDNDEKCSTNYLNKYQFYNTGEKVNEVM